MKKILLTGLTILISIASFATIHTISVANVSYSPSILNIDLGDTVRFNWVSGNHPTAADTTSDWATFPMNSSNTSFDLILTTVGAYPYYCTNHGNVGGSGMSGVINVAMATSVTSIATQPVAVTITENNNASFSLSAINETGFQWQEDTGAGFSNITNGGIYGGATTSTLNLTNVPLSNNGFEYRCMVSGTPDVTSNSALLTVNAMPAGPAIILVKNFEYDPSTLNVEPGDEIQFQWVEGDHPTESNTAAWATFQMNSTNTTFDLILNTEGVYKYFCQNHGSSDGSGMAAEIIVGNPTGISTNVNNTFVVGPNPFEDRISIVHNFYDMKNIEIINAIGSVVKVFNVNQTNTISLSNLKSGMYFVKAYNSESVLLKTIKIVKK